MENMDLFLEVILNLKDFFFPFIKVPIWILSQQIVLKLELKLENCKA